jgi:hypothetical protein
MRTPILRIALLLAVATSGLCPPSRAGAQTPEKLYFAARDASIAEITVAMDAYSAIPDASRETKKAALDKATAMNDDALAKLEPQMRAIIGPVSIAGFDKDGKLNLDGLIKGDQGFGTLDGLTFASADKKTSIIVTTASIFQHWLVEHKDWWGKNSRDVPQQPARAVKENGFYTQALMTDAAIVGFFPLPIRKPAGAAFAFAMAGSRTQDAVPEQTDEIFFAVAKDGRVFIGQTRGFDPIGPIAACEPARKAAISPQRPDDRSQKKLEAKFVSCFAARAKQQPAYSGAVSAAQQLMDAIAKP